MKRQAFEKAYVGIKPANAVDAMWIGNTDLKAWLTSFKLQGLCKVNSIKSIQGQMVGP